METGEYWNKKWRNENLKRVSKENKYKEYLKKKDIRSRENELRKKKEAKVAKTMKKFAAREAPQEIDQRLINKRLNIQNKIGTMGNNNNNNYNDNNYGRRRNYKNNKRDRNKRKESLQDNINSIQSKSNNSNNVSNFLID